MIAAWCAHPSRRDDVARMLPQPVDALARTTESIHAVLSSEGPALVTASGRREGNAPLPFVAFELSDLGDASTTGANAGFQITRGGFGGRPAYVRCEKDVALASTDLSWLTQASRALGFATSLDPDALACACIFDAGEEGRDRTIIREISVIAAGTRAVVSPTTVTRQLLTPPLIASTVDRERRQEIDGESGSHVADLRAHLAGALLASTAGETRVGVLGGGGVDSSALLALAIERALSVNAFAIDLDGAGADRPHLDVLAQHFHLAPDRAPPAAADLPLDLSAAGLPFTWPSGAIESTLMKRARVWGATHVLSGLGADAWFDGNPEAASSWVRTGELRRAIALARAYDDSGIALATKRALWPWARRLVPPRVRWLARRARTHIPVWAGARLSRVMRDIGERARTKKPRIELSAEERIRDAFFSPHLARASELRLQEERIANVTRVDPYLDERLVAFALALPPTALLGSGPRRGLFRAALKGLLPESVRMRKDKASFAPVHRSLFRAQLVDLLGRYAQPRALADLGIVEPRAFGEAFRRAERDDDYAGAEGARLYAVIAVEAFVRGWETR